MLFGNYDLIDIISVLILWGISSCGRALALHVRGTGIYTRILQQIMFLFSLVSLRIALQAIEYLVLQVFSKAVGGLADGCCRFVERCIFQIDGF